MSAFLSSGNPVLSQKIFRKTVSGSPATTMTVQGTLNKFSILLVLTIATAATAWKLLLAGHNILTYVWACVFTAFAIALVLAFKTAWSPILAPVYALVKGFAIGGLSAIYNDRFVDIAPNIITQAVALTFGVVIAMFFLYTFRIIKATQKFKAIVITATIGIFFFYIIAILLSVIGGIRIGFLHEGSVFGILFSLFVVGLAAMNLIVDFDMIEQGSASGAPKYMEWYGAFGLLVTIVWLYIEVLRLLSKFAGRK
jgi:uncharacterized YccA/Bax inhibitor family protein